MAPTKHNGPPKLVKYNDHPASYVLLKLDFTKRVVIPDEPPFVTNWLRDKGELAG